MIKESSTPTSMLKRYKATESYSQVLRLNS